MAASLGRSVAQANRLGPKVSEPGEFLQYHNDSTVNIVVDCYYYCYYCDDDIACRYRE